RAGTPTASASPRSARRAPGEAGRSGGVSSRTGAREGVLIIHARVLITSGIVRIIRSHAAGQYLVRSMSSHFDAGHDSKHFCQMLYRNLAAKIPNMEREETEQWCSLRASGGNK